MPPAVRIRRFRYARNRRPAFPRENRPVSEPGRQLIIELLSPGFAGVAAIRHVVPDADGVRELRAP
jgi:hypothetical protein